MTTKTKKKRLLIIDGLNQFLRSWFVCPHIGNNGEPIGGIVGSMRTLQKTCRTVNPDLIVVAWDGQGGSSRRKAMDKNYKEGRAPLRNNVSSLNLSDDEKEENRIRQLFRLIEYYNKFPVVQFMFDGIEGDDVVSYVVQHEVFKDWKKIIMSSDKDFMQLLTHKDIALLRPGVKLVKTEYEKKRLDEFFVSDTVLEKFGIHPNNFALAKAVVGDPSDNLPGISGMGFATLAKRFPFLSEEKQFYIDDLIKSAKKQNSERKKPLKSLDNLLSEQKRIQKNYALMQLSTPMLTYDAQKIMDRDLKEFVPKFSRSEVRMMMAKDGINEADFIELLGRMQIISNKAK